MDQKRRFPEFYVTAPQPCPYLPGRFERKIFTHLSADRPVALISGVGQVAGLAAAIAIRLARDGWDIASTAWAPYDERMPWGRQDGDSQLIDAVLLRAGARTIAIPADLADITAPACRP